MGWTIICGTDALCTLLCLCMCTVQGREKRFVNLVKQDPGKASQEQLRKSKKKFLATTYQPLFSSLYMLRNTHWGWSWPFFELPSWSINPGADHISADLTTKVVQASLAITCASRESFGQNCIMTNGSSRAFWQILRNCVMAQASAEQPEQKIKNSAPKSASKSQ